MHPQGYPRRRGFVGFFLLLILLGLPWSPARAQGLEGRVTALERGVATLKTTVNRLASEVAALARLSDGHFCREPAHPFHHRSCGDRRGVDEDDC